MTRTGWKRKIIQACREAGTYREHFAGAVDALADILSKRDAAEKAWQDDGAQPIAAYTNKAGAENQVQHPALRLVNDLNRDALAYWRELGLTPAGLRKINEEAMKPRRVSPLAQALRDAGT